LVDLGASNAIHQTREIPEQQYVLLPYEPNQQLEKEASNQERQPEHRNTSTNKTPDQK